MADFQKALDMAMPAIARRLHNELVLTAPVDTGRLRNSIKVVPLETGKGLAIFMVGYALYVEFGSPPHVIKPKCWQFHLIL